MATSTVYPNGDGSIGAWTNQAFSGTNLYLSVDEPIASANDADSIRASTAGTSSAVFLLLEDMPSDFDTMDAMIVLQIRCNASAGFFGSIAFYQSDETTALTNSSVPAVTSTMTNYSLTFTLTGATDKTSWDGARLKISTDTSMSSSLVITALQIDITYSAIAEGVAAALFM